MQMPLRIKENCTYLPLEAVTRLLWKSRSQNDNTDEARRSRSVFQACVVLIFGRQEPEYQGRDRCDVHCCSLLLPLLQDSLKHSFLYLCASLKIQRGTLLVEVLHEANARVVGAWQEVDVSTFSAARCTQPWQWPRPAHSPRGTCLNTIEITGPLIFL